MVDWTFALQVALILSVGFGLIAVFSEQGCDCLDCQDRRADR